MSKIQQLYLLPKIEADAEFCAQFYADDECEPDYNPLPIRSNIMRRSFHLEGINGKLDVSECSDPTQIKLCINDAEVLLDYDAFNELCGLRYTLNLTQRVE